jgi:predicted transcriptional regulator YheO
MQEHELIRQHESSPKAGNKGPTTDKAATADEGPTTDKAATADEDATTDKAATADEGATAEERRAILESYIPLMKFFAQQLPDTEIVLHDISDLDHSIIAIENAHISGRSVGGSSTDLVLRILQEQSYLDRDYTPAYTSTAGSGKFLSSGTFFIKHEGELIGLLCTNTDLTPLHALKKAAEDLFDSRKLDRPAASIDEKLSQSVNDIPVETTLQVMREMDIHPDRVSQDERISLVKELDRRGIFLLKGAIASVSRVLNVSEPTLYRYLRMIRE